MPKTPKHVLKASWRRVMAAGVEVVLAGAVLSAAGALAGPSTAAAATPVKVDCSSDSLQTAIANATPGTKLLVTGTCRGQFTIDKDLMMAGQGPAVLDGQASGTTLTVSSGAAAQLTHLTITGGKARGGGEAGNGGGVNNFGTLTLAQSTVNNNAGSSGGGIYNDSSAALTLNATTISGNRSDGFGGGIYNNGGMTLTGGSVSKNIATYGGGGVFSCCGYGPVMLKDMTISDNTSTGGSGGGLFNLLDYVMLQDSTVRGNTAELQGGGINNNAGSTTLVDSTVANNAARSGGADGSYGGGIYTFSGTVPLTDSAVRGNSPDNCAPADSVDGCSG